MGRRSFFGVFLVISLFANAFCLPTYAVRPRRQSDTDTSSTIPDVSINKNNDITYPPPSNDDDDDFDTSSQPSSGGGSSISSLLNLLGAFFPGSSSSAMNKFQEIIYKMVKDLAKMNKHQKIIKRDINNNKIDDYKAEERIEEENESNETSEEDKRNEIGEDSNSNVDSDAVIDSDEDYDEFPGGDGQGGGLLGLLAGLSGGEDGQSDLGSLLGTIGGIVANLSGDGIDLNSLIASGLGLFVGLLSEGEENPGAVIASYLLTSLDTITGGGSKNNGKFFGTFLSKLIKGISAAVDPAASSEEDGRPQMKDSAGFFISLVMGLLGDMSKGSSGSH